jgi:hypothetical protein
VSFPAGDARYPKNFEGQFQPLTQAQLFAEMKQLLETLELEKTVFRSDHASNYLVLKGVLGKDKARLLELVNTALKTPDQIALRQEWQRGL